MRIVISEFMDVPAVERLKRSFDTRYDPTLADQRARLLAALPDADALIVRNRTRVDSQVLHAASRLRVVGRLGVGLDNIDVAACKARGVEVIPATGANSQAVAEYVVGTAMVLLRGQYGATARVIAGDWPRSGLSAGRELAGKTLGLIGCGQIGRRTAALAHALGMTVIGYDPAIAPEDAALARAGVRLRSLDEVLRDSDVVSLHVPLDGQTRGLLNRERLSSMKRGAIVIDTARGGILDERALAELLAGGHLGGAAIDVFAEEPLAAGSAFAPLREATNLILTPHVAGVTLESNERVSAMIAQRVAAYLGGAPG